MSAIAYATSAKAVVVDVLECGIRNGFVKWKSENRSRTRSIPLKVLGRQSAASSDQMVKFEIHRILS